MNSLTKIIDITNREIVIKQIGDSYLESILPISQPNNIQNEYNIYKRDYQLLSFDTNCDIIQYNIYVIEYNNITYVMNMINKKNLDLPLIYYYETVGNSSEIIDTVYKYQTERSRTLNMKRNKYVVTNTNKYLDGVNLTLNPIINSELTTIDQNLTQLNIILKNKEYISDSDEMKILFFSNLLFYY